MILASNSRKIIFQKIIKRFLLFFVFILLIGIIFVSGNYIYSGSIYNKGIASGNLGANVSNAAEQVAEPTVATQHKSSLNVTNVENTESVNIDAPSAMSVEVKSGQETVLFSKNAEKKLPIASLTKLMTALVSLEKYDLSQKVIISQLAIKQEGEQGNLTLGEMLSVKDLLYITLIESSNRAAFALSEVVGASNFVNLMNGEAQKIGLIDTYFEDSTGINPKSYSTSKDLVKLSKYLFENYPLFGEIIGLKEYNLYLDNGKLHHKLINTNKLLGQSGIIGGKTGWTDTAQGCFMVIQKNYKNGDYFIHIILGAQNRFLEMQKLINRINLNYQ